MINNGMMNALLYSPNGCFAISALALVVLYLGKEYFETVNHGIDHGYNMYASIGGQCNVNFTHGNNMVWDEHEQRWMF